MREEVAENPDQVTKLSLSLDQIRIQTRIQTLNVNPSLNRVLVQIRIQTQTLNQTHLPTLTLNPIQIRPQTLT